MTSLKLQLVIDNRERDLIQLFSQQDISFDVKMLELGDIIIQTEDGTILCIMERKTWDDLYASIKDGRYQNQKKRLMETYDHKKIVYLIEGSGEFHEGSDPQKKILLSCFYNMTFRDNLKIIRTATLSDTVECIRGLWTRYQADPEKYNSNPSEIVHKEHVVKLGVKSAEDFFTKSLCQLPGVSMKTARAISNKYKTLMGMIDALSKLTSDEKIKTLKDITTQDDKGGTRKISSKVAQYIVEYVFA